MGLRRIHTTDEPALHKVCKTVTSFDWRLQWLLDEGFFGILPPVD